MQINQLSSQIQNDGIFSGKSQLNIIEPDEPLRRNKRHIFQTLKTKIDPAEIYELHFIGRGIDRKLQAFAEYTIYDSEGTVVCPTLQGEEKDMTHHEAAYEALKLGLKAAEKLGIKHLKICSTSKAVISHMKGVTKKPEQKFITIKEEIEKLMENLGIEIVAYRDLSI